MATKSNGVRLTTSLVIGLLLVPISAVAAVVLLDPEPVAPASAAEPSTTTTTTVDMAPQQKLIVEPVTADIDDLEAACGSDGLASRLILTGKG